MEWEEIILNEETQSQKDKYVSAYIDYIHRA